MILSEIREKNILYGGDLKKTMGGLFHGHSEAREQLTKKLLQALHLDTFLPFIDAPFMSETDEAKEIFRSGLQHWYEAGVDHIFLAQVTSNMSITVINESKNYPISMRDGGEFLMFIFLLHEHSRRLNSGSEALIKEAIARIIRHLGVFKQFGPLNVLTYIYPRSLSDEHFPVLLSAAKTSVRVGRELLNIALRAPNARDYHLSLLHCYPFLTAAIEICSFCITNAKDRLSEEEARFCDQARKPLREVRDHTMGWTAWAYGESGEEMTLLIDNYRRDVLEVAETKGIEAAKREAIFRCRTLHEVPLFALEEVHAALASRSSNPAPAPDA